MPLDIRLINLTPEPLEIDDGAGGRLVLPPGTAVDYPGELAGPDLRKLLAEGSVIIQDAEEGPPPVEHDDPDD